METRGDEENAPVRRRSTARPPRPRPRLQLKMPPLTRPRLIAAAGVLALGGAATIAIVSSDSTVTMRGSLTLYPGAYAPENGGPCIGAGDYGDIDTGRAIMVGDQTGTTIAVGQLGNSHLITDSDGVGACVFDFDIQVPSGRSLYVVTISGHGAQTFRPDQIQQVDLSLGADAILNSLGL